MYVHTLFVSCAANVHVPQLHIMPFPQILIANENWMYVHLYIVYMCLHSNICDLIYVCTRF